MKKVLIIVLGIILIITTIVLGYAAMRAMLKGNVKVLVAKPIFEVTVNEANSSENLHSYYEVTVKNYNSNNEISMVDFDYTINIETTDGTEVPKYNWYDQEGNLISEELRGTFKNSVKEEKTYKICFINSGNKDIISNIKFRTTAIQKKD